VLRERGFGGVGQDGVLQVAVGGWLACLGCRLPWAGWPGCSERVVGGEGRGASGVAVVSDPARQFLQELLVVVGAHGPARDLARVE
jgi:hypothetical protein